MTSKLPFWTGARFWFPSRPLSGFTETFSQVIAEVSQGGGSERPETDPHAEAVLFIVEGQIDPVPGGETHTLAPCGYLH